MDRGDDEEEYPTGPRPEIRNLELEARNSNQRTGYREPGKLRTGTERRAGKITSEPDGRKAAAE